MNANRFWICYSQKITAFIANNAYTVLLLFTLFACQPASEQTREVTPLFVMEDTSITNIYFRNELAESSNMNGIVYEYYYNGSGVAVADFNNDQLLDIYFVSTLASNTLYLNKGGLQFEDVSQIAGAQGTSAFSTGVTTVDINNDGLIDLYVCASGQIRDADRRRNELLINLGPDENGIPHFEEQGAKYGLDLEDLSTQAAFFDYDRDGDLDMFLINHGVTIYPEDSLESSLAASTKLSGERLYENKHGIFRNVTTQTGIIDNRLSYGLGLSVGDVTNDGWPDIYVGHDFGGEDHLYTNNRDGTFSERIKQSTGHIANFSMGNDMADYNNDGWLDIMTVDMVSEENYGVKTSMSGMDPARFQQHVDLGLHYQYMFNALQLNTGVDTSGIPYFSEVAQLAGVSSTDWSWAPLFFDMNNNGRKDLFISNGIKRDFRNNDFIKFHKSYREAVEKQGNIDEETYFTNVLDQMPQRKQKNYFFRNQGDLTFTKADEVWENEQLTCSNGAAYGDFDNDGDLDIVVNNMDDYAFIYKNTTADQHTANFLKIRFQGASGNRFGIGARVSVLSDSGTQLQENYVTRGFQSSVPPELIFGLGSTALVKQLVVQWPDGAFQT
ncbi:MAG: CRTAC1 family protein, partial [Tunicatimonas sp.]